MPLVFFRYSIPARRQVVKSLEKKKDEMTAKLKSDLERTESVSITHDGWTSLNTESYNTITAHYIDTDWNMKTAVLETKKMEGSHTSEKIATTLEETRQRWSLKDPMATTDNAANEKKAFEILEWPRFGCYGHRLNLVVKNALSVPEVSKILGKGRSLVTFFHSSSSVSDELVSKQKLLLSSDKVGHKLIMDVSTRWNSTLAMLERLCEQTPAIMALASITDDSLSKTALTKIKNCVFNFDEQAIVEKMVILLKPFEIATSILCAEKSPTMNKVLPIVAKLSLSVAEDASDPPVIIALKNKMRSQMEQRTGAEEIALLASVLSPYMKDFGFMPNKMVDAHELLRRSALGLKDTIVVKKEKPDDIQNIDDPPLPALPVLPEEKPNVSEPEPEPQMVPDLQPPSKKIKSADTDDWLMDIVCVGETKQNIENLVEQEIARYLGSNVKAGDECLTVLQWWKANECFYPRISRLAKKYLACQASSVSSERVFSLAGTLVSKKRARLSTSNVDLMIFLNKNMETYW